MERWAEQELYGWGRYPRVTGQAARPERRRDAVTALADRQDDPVLAYGEGRSYGDAALLKDGRIIRTSRLDRVLSFDPASGWLRCEAGVSLKTLIELFVPRGFFPPVVPGTQFVSVGGAIANDIHGKNHHLDGSFGDHIRRLELLTASGDVVVCDAAQEPELFWATVGGLGLTGVILAVDIKMSPIEGPVLEVESVRTENLDEFFAVNAESADYTHTVTWIDSVTRGDCMGRGIFMRGRHAPAGTQEGGGLVSAVAKAASPLLNVPFDAPHWIMNGLTMRMFNMAYFRKHPRGRKNSTAHYEPFFFPLDFVKNWNRAYGGRGMLQYQLVVPHDPTNAAIREVLDTVTAAGMASFLSVIKEFGDSAHPGLSFPRPGITLALDFPNFGKPLYAMLDRLDDVVAAAGGRVYLGKDARLSKAHFRRMYPEWERWRQVRDRWDPDHVFQSELGKRLGLSGEGS